MEATAKDSDKNLIMQKEMPPNEEFSYDVVAYPSFILPQTHPDRLSAIAKILGMNPTPPEKCRVLELGCSDGGNINWMASNLPESEFVGIDLAKTHIIQAEKARTDLGLENASFFQKDVLEISEETFGKFDYIIAHGLFSWVPDFVREKILQLYDELLNPNGVGFISYNVYPGFYYRQIVRDAMRFHSRKLEEPTDKIQQSFGLIELLTEHTAHTPVYHEILKAELNNLAKRSPAVIYHDDLSDINQPFYFTEFIAEAEKHNLQFLSESEQFAPQKLNLPKQSVDVFEKYSRDLIEYEQYADFYSCRRFRQTLLCKKDIELKRSVNFSKIKEVYLTSQLKPTSPTIDLNPQSPKEFVSQTGVEMKISHVLSKVALSSLANIGSHPIAFTELVEKSVELLKSQGVEVNDSEKEFEITASVFHQLFSPFAVRFHTVKPDAVEFISEKPLLNNFARWQLTQDNSINNAIGDVLEIEDDFFRYFLSLLDGTKTRSDLFAELTEVVEMNAPPEYKAELLANLPEKLERDLFILSKMGFLVG